MNPEVQENPTINVSSLDRIDSDIMQNINNALEEFRKIWPVSKIKDMKLSEYTGGKESFCNHLEWKFSILGGIKGGSSFKFGIYTRTGKKADGRNYKHDDTYSWEGSLSNGKSSDEAFRTVKIYIDKIINNAQSNKLEAIDSIKLHQFVKWKIAFIYAPENCLSIYSRPALENICNILGININPKIRISGLHASLLSLKPKNISNQEYSVMLWMVHQNSEAFTNKPEDHPWNSRKTKTGEPKKAGSPAPSYSYNLKEIRSSEVPPAFGVKLISEKFAALIDNLYREDGQMVGIFGQWGRGKTFFMSEVCNHLNINYKTGKEDKNSAYKYVKFHAWKYQDTSAIWAYLYENLSNKYLGENWFLKPFKRIWLNIIRKGWDNLKVTSILAFLFLVILMVYKNVMSEGNSSFDDLNLTEILGIVFGSLGSLIVLIYRKYGQEARSIIKRYTKEISFKEALGLQAEIQKEVVCLVKSWFWLDDLLRRYKWTKKLFIGADKKEKRILLFVDDLDRCSEDKMILLIDAMRVMLEHPEISKKIIIVTAVDDEKLKLAIRNKYAQFLRTFPEDDKKEKFQKLEEEYMDKLFISGIKLAEITADERAEFFNNLVKGKVSKNLESENYEGNEDSHDGDGDSKTNGDDATIIEGDKSTELEEYEISFQEKEILESQIKSMSEATPRQIRIYYYRYLLGKSILEDLSSNEADNKILAERIPLLTNNTDTRPQKDTIDHIVDMVVAY